jgi:hypothetical protein
MKKIGILTFYKSSNYGAILQLYALQKTLSQLGCLPQAILYSDKQKNLLRLSKRGFIINKIWNVVLNILCLQKVRAKKTREFKDKYIYKNNKEYISTNELYKFPPDLDIYIAGSDQVWNPYITGYDETYYLSFAPVEKVKVSYAASFGVSEIPTKDKEKFSYLLKKLDLISVREQHAVEIVKQLSGRNAELSLDPTLLLSKEEWSDLASKADDKIKQRAKKKYILCYYMPGDKLVNQSITSIAELLKDRTKMEIISIGKKEYHKLNPFENGIYDAGPLDFIYLFQNASYVVTNSFHGTAFSIIFEKTFFVPVNNKNSGSKERSSRIVSLLESIGLDSRIVWINNTKIDQDNINPEPISYECSISLLEELRKNSFEFLSRVVNFKK